MHQWYQHLPEYIDPIAVAIGSFEIRWYSLMYLVGFLVVWAIARWRIAIKDKKGSAQVQISKDQLLDILLWGMIGVVIGGRIGYILFYDLGYFLSAPLEIFLPINLESGDWTGIYGMSFHGGLLGAIAAGWWYVWKNKLSFLYIADLIIVAIPLGYFFGRIGNFLNGELYGRETESIFGMYFNGVLRHPSQLYEAVFEGLVLFAVLWSMRNIKRYSGYLLSVYILAYALARFGVEFFREPDGHLGMVFSSWMTMGQLLSVGMFIVGIGMLLIQKYEWLSNKRSS